MKTTLDLPDDLMRAVKIRAAQEDRKLKETIADLIRRGLEQPRTPSDTAPHRVSLPLVECAHTADPGEEITPERAAEILLEEDAADAAV